jgi:hypothetical protein
MKRKLARNVTLCSATEQLTPPMLRGLSLYRALSDAHFSLAVAYVYRASEKDEVEDPLAEKKNALQQYKLAREVLNRAMSFRSCSVPVNVIFLLSSPL